MTKEQKRLINKYNKKEIDWFTLQQYFKTREIVKLLDEGIIKIHKDVVEEKERENIKALMKNLSKKELGVRRAFVYSKFHAEPRGSISGEPHVYFSSEYSDKVKESLRKIPIETAKKVLTKKEFQEVKKKVYEEDE